MSNHNETLHILGIAPYDSMRDVMLRTAEGFPGLQLDVYIGDLEQGVNIVKNVATQGYDAIISRGGTATMIRQVTDLPVIEIQLSVYDVLRTIKLAENYSSLYAIVGFPTITESAHTLCDLLRYDVDILTIHSTQDAQSTLERLRQGGYRMVISDVVTHTVAQQMGFDAFLITSGPESLYTALTQAESQARIYRRLRHENQLLRQVNLLENVWTIVLRKDGSLYYSAPHEPSAELCQILTAHRHEVPRTGCCFFYHNADRMFYKIAAQRITLDWEEYLLFRCSPSQIPLKPGRIGIQILNQPECSQLFINSFYNINGMMGDLEPKLNSIATTRQPVIIIGETGTGKEQIARALYLRGSQQNRPFLVVDCALANEKSWDFLLNHPSSPLNDIGGTVYFQHLDSLPDEWVQPLLSQILESDMPRRKRLIFSCNCPEGAPLTETGHLFASRTGCLSLHLPSLRSRSDEIPSLASLYLVKINQELNKQITGFAPHAMELLVHYSWPRNYSQFKQALFELATLTTSSYIRSSTVVEFLATERSLNSVLTSEKKADCRTLDQITLDAVRQAVAANNGNHSAAARQLGISRTTLWRFMNRLPDE